MEVESGDGLFRACLEFTEIEHECLVLGCMVQHPWKETGLGKIRLQDVEADILALVVKFIKREHLGDLNGLGLRLVQVADYLIMPNLLKVAIRAAARELHLVHGFGLLREGLVKNLIECAEPMGLLHCESMNYDSSLDRGKVIKWVQQAWRASKISRQKAIETYFQQDIARLHHHHHPHHKKKEEEKMQQRLSRFAMDVQHLKLRNKMVDVLPMLQYFPNIVDLDLSGNKFKAVNMMDLVNVLSLQTTRKTGLVVGSGPIYLGLENTGVTDKGLDILGSVLSTKRKKSRQQQQQKQIQRLASLELRNNPIGDVGVQILADHMIGGNLKRLDLSRNDKITAKGLNIICTKILPHLTYLDLSSVGCDVNVVLSNLGDSLLQSLIVAHNFSTISEHGFQNIWKCMGDTLETLDLSGNLFNNWQNISSCKNHRKFLKLKTMILANTNLNVEGTKHLCQAILQTMPNLHTLDVSRNGLPCNGTVFFSMVVGSHEKLKSLNLSGNAFDATVAGAFGAGLAKNPDGLHELKLQVPDWQVRMRTAGCSALCRGLLTITRTPIMLHTLDLTGQMILCRGCILLANVIRRYNVSNLQHLILRENGIQDEGANELATAIVGKPEILQSQAGNDQMLNLASNPISDETKQVISTLLQQFVLF